MPSEASAASSCRSSRRVATRRRVAGGAEAGLGLGAEALADELGHGRLGQGTGPNRGRERLLDDLGQQLGVGAGLVGAESGETQDRQVLEPAQQIPDESQRGLIHPVEVVDGEDQRPLGEVRDEPVEAVERREAARRPAVSSTASNTDLAGAAAPARSRSASSGSASSPSNSWRTTPKAKSPSSSLPRALRTVKPSPAALSRVSASRRLLPMPAGPSINANPGRWSARPASSRSSAPSSSSRSSSDSLGVALST